MLPNTSLFAWETIGITFIVALASIVVYIVFSVLMKQQIASVNDLFFLGMS